MAHSTTTKGCNKWTAAWMDGCYKQLTTRICFGSTYFTIFINDLDDDVKSYMLKFAADVNLIGKVGSEDDVGPVGRLKMNLICVDRWAEKWQMKFNERKCKLIGNRKKEYH